jgi:multiple sugar transport system substrate-binding protein
MKSKKIFAVLLVFSLVLAVLAGCSGSKNNSDASDQASSPAPSSAAVSASASETPAWQTEKITLKYAGYEDPKIEESMLKAFMEKYPNITVVRQNISNPWNDSLTAAASAGDMPDVFWLDNAYRYNGQSVQVGVANDWLLDLSPYYDNDPETDAIYPNVKKEAIYNGKRFATVAWEMLYGVYVNKTLFKKYNVELPPYNWTIDQMLDLAKKLSHPEDHFYGISGANDKLRFQEDWPMANDASLGYNTFDGEKFHFTNQEWIDAYNKQLELKRLKIEEKMTPEEKKKVFGNPDVWPFHEGHVAMAIEGSWTVSFVPAEMKKTGAGDLDFYPYPGGKAGQRMPVLPDYIGVSSATKHPEASYQLMKWMSWGKDGYLKRLDLYKEVNSSDGGLGGNVGFPVTDYPEVWAKIEPLLPLGGEKAIVKLLKDGVPSYGKTLGGMAEYDQWLADSKITEQIEKGEVTPADKAKELEDKINEFVSKAKEELGQ